MTTQNTAPVSGANPAIDLNKVHFFRPVAGKTLREQLAGKKLAGREIVEYMISFMKNDGEKLETFAFPNHWPPKPQGKKEFIEAFCFFDTEAEYVEGFLIAEFVPWKINNRIFKAPEGEKLLDLMVVDSGATSGEWSESSWILIIEEDQPTK